MNKHVDIDMEEMNSDRVGFASW